MKTKCIKCGSLTEWDELLGEPLCQECWDRHADSFNPYAAARRRYREKNPDKVAAWQRAYREKNPDKVAAWQRAYREKNRDKVAAQKRAWYEKNRKRNKSRH